MRSEARTITTTVYICETCGAEHATTLAAEACEKRHRQDSCSHSNWLYETDEDYERYRTRLLRFCKDCKVHQVLDYEDASSETLKQVWAVIAKANTEGK